MTLAANMRGVKVEDRIMVPNIASDRDGTCGRRFPEILVRICRCRRGLKRQRTLRMRSMQLIDLIKGFGLGQREKTEVVDSRNDV